MEPLIPEGTQPKRSRTRKRDDGAQDAPTLSQQPSPMSYKAAVAGTSGGHAGREDLLWPAEETIELTEGDIVPPTGDHDQGITLSQSFKDKLDHQWSQAVVVHLLGRKIGYQALSTRLRALWQPRGPIKIVDLKHDFFLVRFLEESDYFHALMDGPWLIYGQALATVKIDEVTQQAHRGRYARIAIDIDLTQPLKTTVELEAGHSSPTTATAEPGSQSVSATTTRVTAPQHADDSSPSTGGYGPWLYVQRKPRPTPQRSPAASLPPKSRQSTLGQTTSARTRVGSRFHALTDTGLQESMEQSSGATESTQLFIGVGHRRPMKDIIASTPGFQPGHSFKAQGPKPPLTRARAGLIPASTRVRAPAVFLLPLTARTEIRLSNYNLPHRFRMSPLLYPLIRKWSVTNRFSGIPRWWRPRINSRWMTLRV
ncbi:hypothetical protein K2173_004811 [Erythroxylum novogranatense]|uniref:DUF4283 domain-containing protein n=1 Tax=Erythroxylum novogranatense TaxID=1862640 RepID=A0AAV8SKN9_9ROSI|nr:hypothetical protein K2173_004811 [Erythroxylum novogranatense]